MADLYRPTKRCGIYVFSFSNGEAYAGQAVDVTRRYVQHRKVHNDIEAITFKVVRRDKLNDEERRVIRELEAAGVKLRNVIFTSVPHGQSDFDLIMPPEDQGRWIEDVGYNDLDGPRTEDPEMRRRFARRYEQFSQQHEAEEVVRILRTYVRRGIPAFARSEMSFWVCSCLPGSPNPGVQIYSRISIYQQEVFAVYADRGLLSFSWHLARSPLEQAFGPSLSQIYREFPRVEVTSQGYVPGGQDQIALHAEGADNATRLMNGPDVLRSIRLFNLRLMKKGPCIFSRYHCFDLADRFYRAEEDSILAHTPSTLTREAERIARPHRVPGFILVRVRSLLGRH